MRRGCGLAGCRHGTPWRRLNQGMLHGAGELHKRPEAGAPLLAGWILRRRGRRDPDHGTQTRMPAPLKHQELQSKRGRHSCLPNRDAGAPLYGDKPCLRLPAACPPWRVGRAGRSAPLPDWDQKRTEPCTKQTRGRARPACRRQALRLAVCRQGMNPFRESPQGEPCPTRSNRSSQPAWPLRT